MDPQPPFICLTPSGRAFDSLNRQTKVQAPSGNTAYFTYNTVHNLTQRLYGNNAKCDVTYDNAERIESWKNKDAASSDLTQFTYERDAKGLIVKSVREATHTVYYTYDSNDRLTSEIWGSAGGEVYAFKYAHDLAGNRLRSKINGEDTYFSYDQANQLTVKGSNAVYATPTYYTYDQNGSQTKEIAPDGTTYFGYNASGLIAKILWKDASRTYFYYDANLQRYAMDEHGTLTYFLWDGLNILQEQAADGTIKAEHTHAQTPIPGIGQLVETYRPQESAADQKIYPIMDMRGTIHKWVKADGTTVIASREQDAFGRIISNSGTWPSRFGYQGQTWMDIFSADRLQKVLVSPTRIYDPALARFVQNEPFPPSRPLTHYAYLMVHPIGSVDPAGMAGLVFDPPSPSGAPYRLNRGFSRATKGQVFYDVIGSPSKVDCECLPCDCEEGDRQTYYLSCIVYVNLQIHISTSATDRPGVYGHEQRHMKNMQKAAKVWKSKVDERESHFTCDVNLSFSACEKNRKQVERNLTRDLHEELRRAGRHAEPGTPEEPVSGTPYPPIGNFPESPVETLGKLPRHGLDLRWVDAR